INQPRYPTVPMRLISGDAEVKLWNNSIMGLPTDLIGLEGSATQVRKIFSPERTEGEILGDGENKPDEAASLLIDVLLQKDIISV
ncbi:MAG: hypothetical protein KAT81_02665, partial [Syntrophobacterales bacterium]|nr:hypothetical protein [Syntrophobacterales bacterium]